MELMLRDGLQSFAIWQGGYGKARERPRCGCRIDASNYDGYDDVERETTDGGRPMATTVFETYGVIRADGTLELENKLTPAPGRFKVRVESIDAPDVELTKRLAELIAMCDEDTRYSSKLKNKLEHPAFREIVAMGGKAVPLLLGSLEKNQGSRWTLTLALDEITGVNPIPEECAGKIEKIVAAWLTWGQEQGYR